MPLTQKFLLLFFAILFISLPLQAKDRWVLDRTLSSITFELPVLLANNVKGTFDNIEGLVEIDTENQKNNKAIFSVALDSIDMNYTKYKDLLLGSVFFDAKNFPIALVDTKKFTYKNEQETTLVVDLSIKGTTQKVPLQIEVYHLADEVVQIKTRLIFSRTAFSIGTGRWGSTAVLQDKATIQTNLFLFKE